MGYEFRQIIQGKDSGVLKKIQKCIQEKVADIFNSSDYLIKKIICKNVKKMRTNMFSSPSILNFF